MRIPAANGAFDAYLAAPSAGRGPAVILVTHIFGVCQDTQAYCDRLAEAGCVGVAPDFFWRDDDKGPIAHAGDGYARARARAGRTEDAWVMDDIRHTIAALKAHPACNGKFAAWGFCFGGPFVWRAACDGVIDAGASFHGTIVSRVIKPGDALRCPATFQYGDKDELAPPEELEKVRKAVTASPLGSFAVHPGAGHGYMMMSRPTGYDPMAAQKSWDAAMALLAPLKPAQAAE
jgi:carboxymethylenebutenolidase